MRKFKKILKCFLLGVGVSVGVCAMAFWTLTAVTMYSSYQHTKNLAATPTGPYEPPELDFTVADGTEPLEIDTYELRELAVTKTLCIYDADYLDMFFKGEKAEPEDLKETVRNNSGIGPRFKDLLYTYIDAIAARYPEADLRILHYNLQTLEVVERTTKELAFDSLSLSAYGCYKRAENKIYVSKDYDYQPGTWEYQVILHEFGHAARSVQRSEGGNTLYIQLSKDYMEIPEEALNSLFTVSLLDYEEKDVAYQLQSNMFGVMIECLDGEYVLSDYINHSLSYFAKKLDEKNGDNNYALTIFRLIQEQRTDYMDDRYERPPETYYPIYEYICKMYLARYAPEGADREEIHRLVDELLEKVTYDVPEDYHIPTGIFYSIAQTLYAS